MSGKFQFQIRNALPRVSCLAIIGVFILAKFEVFSLDADGIFPDTASYSTEFHPRHEDGSTRDFIRPITIPIMYRILGVHGPVESLEAERLSRVTSFQYLFSSISWLILGCILAWTTRIRSLKPAALAITLGLSISSDISQWDRILISESISTSSFVLFLAVSVVGLNSWQTHLAGKLSKRVSYVAIFLSLAALFSFSRDTNSYLIFQLAILLVVLTFRRWERDRPAWILQGVISLGLLAIFSVQLISSNIGQRWYTPFLNVFFERIRQDDAAIALFREEGLPLDDNALFEIRGLTRKEFNDWLRDEKGDEISAWMKEKGSSTYVLYLLRDPIRTLGKPLLSIAQMISPDSSEYRKVIKEDPVWLTAISAIFFPKSILVLCMLLIIPLLLMIRFRTKVLLDPNWLLPLFLLVSAFPLMSLIYHGDAIELERHAFQIALQLRIAAWLSILYLVDAWMRRSSNGSNVSTGKSGNLPSRV